MKQLITFIFVIVLMGNPHQWQIDIASKYNLWIRPTIEIEITNDLECDDCLGYNMVRGDEWGEIKVRRDFRSPYWRLMFESTLIHEMLHHVLEIQNEKVIDRITNDFIKLIR